MADAQLTAINAGVRHCKTNLIDQCGHAPHLEQQKLTMKFMVQFILKNLKV